MYTEYFSLIRKPFLLNPDSESLYLSPKYKKALTLLQYGLVNEAGIIVISGEIGTGKTTLILRALKEINNKCVVGHITNTCAAFGDMRTWVLNAFKIKEIEKTDVKRYQQLVDYLKQLYVNRRRAVLIIDEAQNMDLQALEELRLLSNVNVGHHLLLQLVLIGQPKLIKKLKSPQLEQFAQRISIEIYLTPLNYEQTLKYIYHRIEIVGGRSDLFSQEACDAIYYYTDGTPRLINKFCELALVFAFAEDETRIIFSTVLEVAKENKTLGIVSIKKEKAPGTKEIKDWFLYKHKIDLDKV